MRSLVTGGAGFIGSHVARHCLKMGHEVTVIDDLSGGFLDQVPDGATFIQGDITDYHLINSLFSEVQYDYIYHLAAYAAEGLSHFIRRFNYSNNLIGSINLINQAIKHNVKCFVFTSSIAVYGAGQLPMHESMLPQPEDPYGIAKYAVELDLSNAHEMFGLNYIIFRPHNVYGEHQNIGDKYRNVIGIFMNQIMQGEPLTIFGDGTQTRAFSYIDDVAPHIARSVTISEAYRQVINIGADIPYTVKYLAEKVGQAFSVNYHNCVSLEEGIFRMAAWAQKAGARKSKEFRDIEILTNLPKGW